MLLGANIFLLRLRGAVTLVYALFVSRIDMGESQCESKRNAPCMPLRRQDGTVDTRGRFHQKMHPAPKRTPLHTERILFPVPSSFT